MTSEDGRHFTGTSLLSTLRRDGPTRYGTSPSPGPHRAIGCRGARFPRPSERACTRSRRHTARRTSSTTGGDVIRAAMRANPELDGGVFDLPHIAPAATEAAEAEGLDHRFTAVGGGFFASVPSADLYALKYILEGEYDLRRRRRRAVQVPLADPQAGHDLLAFRTGCLAGGLTHGVAQRRGADGSAVRLSGCLGHPGPER
ncbi:methyltransferase [Streptomyces prunicolor]|uniref:methyltransferase n=1 Tax=Streptomyces prunicolor TaxID=67348 RepID=UPI003441F0DA